MHNIRNNLLFNKPFIFYGTNITNGLKNRVWRDMSKMVWSNTQLKIWTHIFNASHEIGF